MFCAINVYGVFLLLNSASHVSTYALNFARLLMIIVEVM